MERRIAVKGIFIHNNKLLCVKLKPYKEFISGDFWCTIGGGVDEGEALIPALEREIIEETGIKPIVGKLLYIQQFAGNNKEHIEFFFNIINASDYTNVDLSKTTHGVEEIEIIDYIDPIKHTVQPTFLTEQVLSDVNSNSTVKLFNYL